MYPSEQPSAPTEYAPWMPLEGLMEQWAAVAVEEEAMPFFEVNMAVSQAFAALAREQAALATHQLALCSGHEVLFDYEPIMHDLQHASTSWAQVVSVLDRHLSLHRVAPEQAATLRARLADALRQRQRLWRIGACLLAEQQQRYQQEAQP